MFILFSFLVNSYYNLFWKKISNLFVNNIQLVDIKNKIYFYNNRLLIKKIHFYKWCNHLYEKYKNKDLAKYKILNYKYVIYFLIFSWIILFFIYLIICMYLKLSFLFYSKDFVTLNKIASTGTFFKGFITAMIMNEITNQTAFIYFKEFYDTNVININDIDIVNITGVDMLDFTVINKNEILNIADFKKASWGDVDVDYFTKQTNLFKSTRIKVLNEGTLNVFNQIDWNNKVKTHNAMAEQLNCKVPMHPDKMTIGDYHTYIFLKNGGLATYIGFVIPDKTGVIYGLTDVLYFSKEVKTGNLIFFPNDTFLADAGVVIKRNECTLELIDKINNYSGNYVYLPKESYRQLSGSIYPVDIKRSLHWGLDDPQNLEEKSIFLLCNWNSNNSKDWANLYKKNELLASWDANEIANRPYSNLVVYNAKRNIFWDCFRFLTGKNAPILQETYIKLGSMNSYPGLEKLEFVNESGFYIFERELRPVSNFKVRNSNIKLENISEPMAFLIKSEATSVTDLKEFDYILKSGSMDVEIYYILLTKCFYIEPLYDGFWYKFFMYVFSFFNINI